MTSKTNMVGEISKLKKQLEEYRKIANDNAKTCAKLTDDLINQRKELISEFIQDIHLLERITGDSQVLKEIWVIKSKWENTK